MLDTLIRHGSARTLDTGKSLFTSCSAGTFGDSSNGCANSNSRDMLPPTKRQKTMATMAKINHADENSNSNSVFAHFKL
jgi:hypothetical protein